MTKVLLALIPILFFAGCTTNKIIIRTPDKAETVYEIPEGKFLSAVTEVDANGRQSTKVEIKDPTLMEVLIDTLADHGISALVQALATGAPNVK